MHIQQEFPSPLIKVEGVFWLFILMVIKCLSNLFKKYFSNSMILLMCWIPAPTLIKPIFAKKLNPVLCKTPWSHPRDLNLPKPS